MRSQNWMIAFIRNAPWIMAFHAHWKHVSTFRVGHSNKLFWKEIQKLKILQLHKWTESYDLYFMLYRQLGIMPTHFNRTSDLLHSSYLNKVKLNVENLVPLISGSNKVSYMVKLTRRKFLTGVDISFSAIIKWGILISCGVIDLSIN